MNRDRQGQDLLWRRVRSERIPRSPGLRLAELVGIRIPTMALSRARAGGRNLACVWPRAAEQQLRGSRHEPAAGGDRSRKLGRVLQAHTRRLSRSWRGGECVAWSTSRSVSVTAHPRATTCHLASTPTGRWLGAWAGATRSPLCLVRLSSVTIRSPWSGSRGAWSEGYETRPAVAISPGANVQRAVFSDPYRE